MQVVVFSSSQCADPIEFELAHQLGKELASQGWIVVNGGGPGLMDAVLQGAKSVEGRTMAVRLGRHAREQSVHADQYTSSPSLRQRQARMLELGDAFVALPGGIGTHYEVFEILALKNAGELDVDVPLILLGPGYRRIAEYLQMMVEAGHVSEQGQSFFRQVDDVSACISALKGALEAT